MGAAEPSARPGPLHWLVAVLVPLALVAGWIRLVLSFGDLEAGEVLYGGSEQVAAIDADPEVVIVGNSLAYRGVDPERLKRELGVQGEVYVLAIPGSWAPTWYAALKNQVYAHGLQPRLVVVLNTLEFMLRTDRPTGRAEADLRAVMTDDEPVIQEKVYGARRIQGPLAEIQDKRGRVGEAWLDFLVAAPFAVAGKGGAEASRRALSEVFDAPGAVDPRLNERVIPVVELDQGRRTEVRDPAQTLLPDLVELAQSHGSRVVIARIPVLREGRKMHPLPNRETERKTLALLNERGAGYVDLHAVNLPPTAYMDGQHMSVAGRALFTDMLADALKELGALGDDPFPEAQLPPRPPAVRREGRPAVELPPARLSLADVSGCRVAFPAFGFSDISDAALAELGLGEVSPLVLRVDGRVLTPHRKEDPEAPCGGTSYHDRWAIHGWIPDGDPWKHRYRIELSEDVPILPPRTEDPAAWWVLPGTALVLEYDEDAGLPDGPASVSLSAVSLGQGALPTFVADEVEVELERRGARVTGAAKLPRAPRVLRVASPRDGSWVLVRYLGMEVGDWTGHLLGAPAEAGTAVRLLSDEAPPEIRAEPPYRVVPHGGVVAGKEPGEPPFVALPEYGFLSVPGLGARTGIKQDLPEGHPYRYTMLVPVRQCTPFRLFEDGAELARVRDPRVLARPTAAGQSMHRRRGIVFRPVDGTTEGHTYEVRLAEDRLCEEHLWIYPGDVVEIRNPTLTRRLFSGADTLVLGGFAFGNRASPLVHVTVESDAGIHLDTTVRVGRLEAEQVPLRLVTRLPPMPTDAVVRLSTSEDGPWVLMQVVAFEDRGRPSLRKRPRPRGASQRASER